MSNIFWIECCIFFLASWGGWQYQQKQEGIGSDDKKDEQEQMEKTKKKDMVLSFLFFFPKKRHEKIKIPLATSASLTVGVDLSLFANGMKHMILIC